MEIKGGGRGELRGEGRRKKIIIYEREGERRIKRNKEMERILKLGIK